MRLTFGDTAPAFETTSIDGRPIRLDDFRGQKLLLAFFRYASCPLCNLRISELIRHHTELLGKACILWPSSNHHLNVCHSMPVVRSRPSP